MQSESLGNVNIAERLVLLSQQRATGKLILSSGDAQWHLYLFLGRLLYARGGIHRVRRWHRAVIQYCPSWKLNVSHGTKDELWEYNLLKEGISQRQLTLTQARSIIGKIVHEVLFSLVNRWDLKSLWLPKKLQPITLLEVEQSLQSTTELLAQWVDMGLEKLDPDMVPIFKPGFEENLQASKALLSINQFINGEKTIWDIASQKKQSVASVGSILKDLVNKGLIELITVPDLPISNALPLSSFIPERQTQFLETLSIEKKKTSSSQYVPSPLAKVHPSTERQLVKLDQDKPYDIIPSLKITHNQSSQSTGDSPFIEKERPEKTGSLIAYIDDSPNDSLIMGKIINEASYQFISIQDPVAALPMLLEYKPSLIFLDLIMPLTNGYEICSQIHRVSTLKKTPIIIVTSNDGIIDRVRSKMAGSSGFLAKPVTPEKVLTILQKHLLTPLPLQYQNLETIQV